jgi:hypothetical protein
VLAETEASDGDTTAVVFMCVAVATGIATVAGFFGAPFFLSGLLVAVEKLRRNHPPLQALLTESTEANVTVEPMPDLASSPTS